ncbi:MAG: hypothetical protein V7740_18515, partial [Pseudomonas marincola]
MLTYLVQVKFGIRLSDRFSEAQRQSCTGKQRQSEFEVTVYLHQSEIRYRKVKMDRPITEIKRFWEETRTAASLPDIRLHDLRH